MYKINLCKKFKDLAGNEIENSLLMNKVLADKISNLVIQDANDSVEIIYNLAVKLFNANQEIEFTEEELNNLKIVFSQASKLPVIYLVQLKKELESACKIEEETAESQVTETEVTETEVTNEV